jgi:hypothetical protein
MEAIDEHKKADEEQKKAVEEQKEETKSKETHEIPALAHKAESVNE